MIAKYTANGVTYTGFDDKDNGKIFVEEKGDYTYVVKQVDEWTQKHITITALNRDNITEKSRYFLHDISRQNYKDLNEGKTLYRVCEFCDASLAEKVFYDKEEAIKAISDYFQNGSEKSKEKKRSEYER